MAFFELFSSNLLGVPSYINEYTQDYQPEYHDKLVL